MSSIKIVVCDDGEERGSNVVPPGCHGQGFDGIDDACEFVRLRAHVAELRRCRRPRGVSFSPAEV